MNEIPDGQTPADIHRVEVDGIELAWQPERRLARLAFVSDHSTPHGHAARQLISSLTEWTAGSHAPFGILVDCSHVLDADADWRTIWADYYGQERPRARVAWYEAELPIQVMIRMFVTALGATGEFIAEPFATEQEARAWLRTQGIDA